MREQAVFAQLARWLGEGDAYLCTVLGTWGSSPRPTGSLLASNGREWIGSLSGGCIEEDLIARLHAGVFTLPAQLERYGETAEQAARLKLPCGGVLSVLVERLTNAQQAPCEQIAELLAKRQALQLVRNYSTDRANATERWQISPCAGLSGAFAPDVDLIAGEFQQVFSQPLGPVYRLLLVGATEVSKAVAQLALLLDYEVVVVDPDAERLAQWDIANCELREQLADDAVLACANDERAAILALTHDPRVDDMALLEAFNTKAFYIGAMGSVATSKKRRERLLHLGVAAEELNRLRAPIGLDIGSKTPMEIAISIIAELTKLRHCK